jgi:hypothetical protein
MRGLCKTVEKFAAVGQEAEEKVVLDAMIFFPFPLRAELLQTLKWCWKNGGFGV